MADMFMTDKKLRQRVDEAAKYRYRDTIQIPWFYKKIEEDTSQTSPAVVEEFDENQKFNKGDIWATRDGYMWLRTDITIPEEWKGRRVLGFFDFGRFENVNWEFGRFEAMCYLDKKPYTGVDQNHREVFFKEEMYGKTQPLTFRVWSGLDNGGVPETQELRFKEAFLAWLDEKTDDFYYLGNMILETIHVLADCEAVKYALRNALDRACAMIDWSRPGSEEFYSSLYKADDFLNAEIDSMDGSSDVKIRVVGHTHIDLAWLWRTKHSREKGSRSFSTVLRLMDMYPEYIFLQTQPQLYAWIKEDYPELFEKIREKVKEGRWEADGAMWVEADCNLTSGESLTRQILQGTRFLQEEFGKSPEFLWLPDVFGYSWALPQILKKSGINTFMTTKISWNQYNRMPHDTFNWKGLDGTEILTHFVTTPDPGPIQQSPFYYTYNGSILADTVKGAWNNYCDKEVNQELLICYGHGDGGGGVDRTMLENRRRINKMPGLPEVTTSTAGEYFRSLHETVDKSNRYVHTWDGELYLEFHRGTYTSQAYNKRMNRKMELLYRRAEWLSAMKALADGNLNEAKQEELTEGWKLILTNQFHDIIPGSSIHEVYEDSRKDYEKVQEIGCSVEEDAVAGLMDKKDNAYSVFNASGWELTELVNLPDCGDGVYTDKDGNVCESQRTADGVLVKAENVPEMGCRTFYFKPQEVTEAADSFKVDGKEVETPFYIIRFNEAGQIERLYDKTFDREVLPKGERGNVLQVFEDKPNNFDAWDIDIFYQQKMQEITNLVSFEVKEMGSLRMVIRMEWKYGDSVFVQDVKLYRDDRRIDFQTFADYHEQHQLVKAAFPVDIRSTYATYDIQYGNVRRPNNWNTSWEQAKFESVAHRFVDLSERDYGVSLLNDCKYGHDIKDNVMRISLLKAATYPDYAADLGEHYFTYSLLPHGGDFVEGDIVKSAYQLNNPMKTAEGESCLPYESFFTIDNPYVEIDAVKKSEDGKALVVRFHEYAGSRQRVELKPNFGYKVWAESDLMEHAIEEFKDGDVKLELRPYEIKTVLFK